MKWIKFGMKGFWKWDWIEGLSRCVEMKSHHTVSHDKSLKNKMNGATINMIGRDVSCPRIIHAYENRMMLMFVLHQMCIMIIFEQNLQKFVHAA